MDSLELSDKQSVRDWLKGFEHEVLLVRRVFTNKDGVTIKLNHFALRMKLLIKASQQAYQQLQKLQAA